MKDTHIKDQMKYRTCALLNFMVSKMKDNEYNLFLISASECNRLKLQLEDMRQAQEAKDNTMLKIQEQIQRLFEVRKRSFVDS